MKKRDDYQARVLRLLSNYLTIEQIAKTLNKGSKTIYKLFSNYQKKGWINKDRTLTTTGFQKVENAMAISQKVEFQPNSIRLHNLVFKVNIKKIREWKNKEKLLNLKQISFKTIDLGTWKTEQIVIDNRKIWLNPNKLILYMGDYYENTPLEAFEKSLQDMRGLIQKVENTLCLKLLSSNFIDFEVSRQHYALIKNQLAEQYNKEKKKLSIYDDRNELRLLIDDSPSKETGIGLKEFEAVHNEKSREDSTKVQDVFKDYIDKDHYLPSQEKNKIDKIEDNLLKTTELLEYWDRNIQKHFKVLNKIEKAIDKLAEKQKPLKEYINQEKLSKWIV